jgi:hypothetical protein
MRFAERGKGGDAVAAPLEALPRPSIVANASVESVGRDVHSTDDSCHGNLPCPCDGQSSDCPVVRDTAATGPNAPLRLWPEGRRATVTARWVWRPPDPSQRRSHHHAAPMSRYKGHARRPFYEFYTSTQLCRPQTSFHNTYRVRNGWAAGGIVAHSRGRDRHRFRYSPVLQQKTFGAGSCGCGIVVNAERCPSSP